MEPIICWQLGTKQDKTIDGDYPIGQEKDNMIVSLKSIVIWAAAYTI